MNNAAKKKNHLSINNYHNIQLLLHPELCPSCFSYKTVTRTCIFVASQNGIVLLFNALFDQVLIQIRLYSLKR